MVRFWWDGQVFGLMVKPLVGWSSLWLDGHWSLVGWSGFVGWSGLLDGQVLVRWSGLWLNGRGFSGLWLDGQVLVGWSGL
jgi:hypothetical protein